jgi:CHAT domain-containing protein/Tfp pilus assembly protein PilF
MRRLLLALTLSALASVSSGQERTSDGTALEERVWELRAQGAYGAAAESAEALRDWLQAQPSDWLMSLELSRVDRHIATLRLIADLDPVVRRRLASADSLRYVIADYRNLSMHTDAARAAERQVSVYRDILGAESDEVARALTDLAYVYSADGNWPAAENSLREGLVAWRVVLDDDPAALALYTNNVGGFLNQRGDGAAAEQLYREALSVAAALPAGGGPIAAIARGNLAGVLVERGDLGAAEELHRSAIDRVRQLPKEDVGPFLGLPIIQLAHTREELGDYREAEALLREAVVVQTDYMGASHPFTADALGSLADFLDRHGRSAEAEQFLREALSIRTELGRPTDPASADAIDRLGQRLVSRGDYAAADPLLREALAIRRDHYGSGHPEVARSSANMAAVLASRGDMLGAQELLREALEINRAVFGETHSAVAHALDGLGAVEVALGDFAEAERLTREALSVYRGRLGDDASESHRCRNTLGRILLERGELEEAASVFEEALTARTAGPGDGRETARTLAGLAAVEFVRGREEEAESLLREAIATADGLPGAERELASGHTRLAGMLAVRGELAKAESLLIKAAEYHEQARLLAGTAGTWTGFPEQSPYGLLAAVRAAGGRPEDALAAVERRAGRMLAGALSVSWQEVPGLGEEARAESIKQALVTLESEVAVYAEAARHDTTFAARLRLRDSEARLAAAEAALASLDAPVISRERAAPALRYDLQRIRAALDGNSAIVGWVDVLVEREDHQTWGYVVRKTGSPEWIQLEGSGCPDAGRPVLDLARSLRRCVSSSESPMTAFRREARLLHEELLEPLGGALEGIEEIVVVPYGPMLGVPVEALIDASGVLVGERFVVTYAPSGTIYAWLSERAADVAEERQRATLLIGDPPFCDAHLTAMDHGEGIGDDWAASAQAAASPPSLLGAVAGNRVTLSALPRLPGSRAEVTAVGGIAPEPVMLLGSSASEEELVRLAESDELARFGTIHFATHALMDNDRPERSALVMSQIGLPDPLAAAIAGDRIYDGLITAKEIVRQWTLDADLVTLSACETGLGKEVAGEGYVGFGHAFLESGARSVVVGLWKVEDEATSLLMQRFYGNLFGKHEAEREELTGEPMTKAAALQEAKSWLRGYEGESGEHTYEHPYYWSAFILIGDRS